MQHWLKINMTLRRKRPIAESFAIIIKSMVEVVLELIAMFEKTVLAFT